MSHQILVFVNPILTGMVLLAFYVQMVKYGILILSNVLALRKLIGMAIVVSAVLQDKSGQL